MRLRRRDVLSIGLGSAASAFFPKSAWPQAAIDSTSVLSIIDTHTHFYDPTRPNGVPWPSKSDALLYRAVLPNEFQTLTKPFGVRGTVVVEASPLVEDNQWLLDLANDNPVILGVVGNLTPGTEAFAGQLARFAKNPLYRGIRTNSSAIKKGIDKPEFLRDLQRLFDADLELDVNGGPETVQLVDQLAEKLPRLRIVINHMANVKIDGKKPPEDWLAGLQAAGENPNVFLKVSALIENARVDGQKTPSDPSYYLPNLQAAWEAFGPNRLIYGSNWPVSNVAGPYSLVFRIVSEFFGDKGREASLKFFFKNAYTAYRWSEKP